MRAPARRLPVAGLATVLLAGGLAGCSSLGSEEATGTPASPAPVALKQASAPKDLEVGVVVSLTSAPGRAPTGAGPPRAPRSRRTATASPAAASRSARWTTRAPPRVRRGAVRKLVQEGVAGIVLATAGTTSARPCRPRRRRTCRCCCPTRPTFRPPGRCLAHRPRPRPGRLGAGPALAAGSWVVRSSSTPAGYAAGRRRELDLPLPAERRRRPPRADHRQGRPARGPAWTPSSSPARRSSRRPWCRPCRARACSSRCCSPPTRSARSSRRRWPSSTGRSPAT